MHTCPRCGFEDRLADSRHCSECGALFSGETASAAPGKASRDWKKIGMVTAALLVIIPAQHFLLKPADPAKKAVELGFASVDEMKALTERGYKTKADFDAAKARTAAFFAKECKSASKDDYKAKCYGKRVIWTGLLKEHDGKTASIYPINDDGTRPTAWYTVDSTSIAKLVDKALVGRMITFDADIDDQNWVTPDVENAKIVSIESDEKYAARRAQVAARIARAEENEKKCLRLFEVAYVSEGYQHMSAALGNAEGYRASSDLKRVAEAKQKECDAETRRLRGDDW